VYRSSSLLAFHPSTRHLLTQYHTGAWRAHAPEAGARLEHLNERHSEVEVHQVAKVQRERHKEADRQDALHVERPRQRPLHLHHAQHLRARRGGRVSARHRVRVRESDTWWRHPGSQHVRCLDAAVQGWLHHPLQAASTSDGQRGAEPQAQSCPAGAQARRRGGCTGHAPARGRARPGRQGGARQGPGGGLARQHSQDATDEKLMPRQESAMGKWKPSVDIRCLFSMMSPEDTAIQPTHAATAAACAARPLISRTARRLLLHTRCFFSVMSPRTQHPAHAGRRRRRLRAPPPARRGRAPPAAAPRGARAAALRGPRLPRPTGGATRISFMCERRTLRGHRALPGPPSSWAACRRSTKQARAACLAASGVRSFERVHPTKH